MTELNSEGIYSPSNGTALSPRNGAAIRENMSVENKYKNEWYPEGFDHRKGTFLKRSLQSHAFNPNRTFSNNMYVQDQLIPKLYVQSNDKGMRKQRRQGAQDLDNAFREGQFNIVETEKDRSLDFVDGDKTNMLRVGDLLRDSRSAGRGGVGGQTLNSSPDTKAYRVVSNHKKKTLEET